MLLDDRRIVLALEAVCWGATVLILLQQHDSLPRALAVMPLLLGMLIRMEYPPPGRGVSKPGEALSELVLDNEKRRSSMMGADGQLLRGHAYVLTFLRKTPAAMQHMPRMHRLAKGCEQVRSSVHFLAITPGDDDAAEQIKESKAGRAASKDTPVMAAVDSAGTAWQNYMRRHGARSLPHVFVVNSEGTITWHGQVNRRGLVPAIKAVVSQVDPKHVTSRKVE